MAGAAIACQDALVDELHSKTKQDQFTLNKPVEIFLNLTKSVKWDILFCSVSSHHDFYLTLEILGNDANGLGSKLETNC